MHNPKVLENARGAYNEGMSHSIVEYYFEQCPEFVDLLDVVRERYPESKYKNYATLICTTLNIPMHEVSIILVYLLSGKRIFDISFDKVSVATGEDVNPQFVYLRLLPDATQQDVLDFATNNWKQVKKVLDANFPNRKRKTVEIPKLNDWLEIADKVYLYKKEGLPNKQMFYENLALNYKIKSTEVQKYAKRYKILMALKHPSFESDVKSTDTV